GPVAAPDHHHALDACCPGPPDGSIAVTVKLFVVQMAVRIDQPDAQRCTQFKGVRIHFRCAPTGMSSRKLASTGLPPSTDAATIMPFEVRPRSLRGARLATITTLRPTSASGAYASAMPATIDRGSASAKSTFKCNSLSAPLTRS